MSDVPIVRGRILATLAWLLMASIGMTATVHAQPKTSADEAYLDALAGPWLMKGTLGDKPVRYWARGRRVLQGGFLSLHMRDADPASQYEAEVFIGYDAKAQDFVAHWLDKYGAAGARVVASGRRDGDRLVLMFPYEEGAFRDTFTRGRKSGTWTLLIESQTRDESWSTFATYRLTRPPTPPPP